MYDFEKKLLSQAVGIDKVCPICKKKFLVHMMEMHRYTIKSSNGVNDIPVCSWKCLREAEESKKSLAQRKKEERIQRQLKGLM